MHHKIKYFPLWKYLWNICDRMTPECVFIPLCIHFKYMCGILMNLGPFVLLRGQILIHE